MRDDTASPALPPIAYSIDDAARAIRIGHTKVYELMRDGSLDRIKIGRRTLIRAESVRRLVGA